MKSDLVNELDCPQAPLGGAVLRIFIDCHGVSLLIAGHELAEIKFSPSSARYLANRLEAAAALAEERYACKTGAVDIQNTIEATDIAE